MSLTGAAFCCFVHCDGLQTLALLAVAFGRNSCWHLLQNYVGRASIALLLLYCRRVWALLRRRNAAGVHGRKIEPVAFGSKAEDYTVSNESPWRVLS